MQGDSPSPNKRGGKRKQVRRACAACAVAHVACSDQRPCYRCLKRGIQCLDRERKKRRRGEDEDDGGIDPRMMYLAQTGGMPGLNPFLLGGMGLGPDASFPMFGTPLLANAYQPDGGLGFPQFADPQYASMFLGAGLRPLTSMPLGAGQDGANPTETSTNVIPDGLSNLQLPNPLGFPYGLSGMQGMQAPKEPDNFPNLLNSIHNLPGAMTLDSLSSLSTSLPRPDQHVDLQQFAASLPNPLTSPLGGSLTTLYGQPQPPSESPNIPPVSYMTPPTSFSTTPTNQQDPVLARIDTQPNNLNALLEQLGKEHGQLQQEQFKQSEQLQHPEQQHPEQIQQVDQRQQFEQFQQFKLQPSEQIQQAEQIQQFEQRQQPPPFEQLSPKQLQQFVKQQFEQPQQTEQLQQFEQLQQSEQQQAEQLQQFEQLQASEQLLQFGQQIQMEEKTPENQDTTTNAEHNFID